MSRWPHKKFTWCNVDFTMDLILFPSKAISSLIQPLVLSLLHFNTKLSVSSLRFEYIHIWSIFIFSCFRQLLVPFFDNVQKSTVFISIVRHSVISIFSQPFGIHATQTWDQFMVWFEKKWCEVSVECNCPIFMLKLGQIHSWATHFYIIICNTHIILFFNWNFNLRILRSNVFYSSQIQNAVHKFQWLLIVNASRS